MFWTRKKVEKEVESKTLTLKEQVDDLLSSKKEIEEQLDQVRKATNSEIHSKETRIASLNSQIERLEKKTRELELEAKISEEDIAHMLKMKEDRAELELQKTVMKLKAEQQKAIQKVKDEYARKTEESLENQRKEMKAMYSEVLARLPNLNAKMKIE